VLTAWLASSAWLYRVSVGQADRQLDTALVYAAHALLAVLAHEAPESDQIDLSPVTETRADQVVYQLQPVGGPIVLRSPGAPVGPMTTSPEVGFTDAVVEGRPYRVYTLQTSDGVLVIHVGQPTAIRSAMARAAAIELVWPGLVLLGVLAVGVWAIVRGVTTPVERFAHELDARSPEDPQPVNAFDLPRELRPVETAVSRLLERVHAALLHERTLTADAAHELRTPLATLRTQAQVALRARNAGERTEALRDLIAGSDRAARLIGAVLTMARLDAQRVCLLPDRKVDLAQLVRHAIAELALRAEQRGVRVESALEVTQADVDEDALGIAVRNLIDNALRYARTRIVVESRLEDGALVLAVRDDGPGMAPEIAARAFDRFYRGEQGDTGSGLGLALVRRVAELHSGTVRLGAGLDGTGTAVEIVLPAVQPKNSTISETSTEAASSAM
jgi:signal transduction histidine kinase